MDDFKALDLFGDGIATKSEEDTLENAVDNTSTQEFAASQDVQQDGSVTDDATEAADEVQKPLNTDAEGVNPDGLDEIYMDANNTKAINGKLESIENSCTQIATQLSGLQKLFDKRIMHAEYEDRIIDQMHSELQKYKEDMYSQLIRPILLDIIEVRDSIMRIAATYQKKPDGEQDIPNKTFSDYSYDLQDILEKNNVEIYRSNAGDAFTPIRQKVVKKEITHDEGLHGKIAESLSSGYSYTGRVISAEKVSVFYYEKAEEAVNESEETDNG